MQDLFGTTGFVFAFRVLPTIIYVVVTTIFLGQSEMPVALRPMGWFGHPELNLEALIGHAFAPLAWLIGVPWAHAGIAGDLIGQKLILNKFVGYASLAPYLKDPAAVIAAGLQVLDPKTIVIVSFAPGLRSQVARYGLRVVVAASLSKLRR